MVKKLSVLIALSLVLTVFVPTSKADELLDVQKEIDKKNSELKNVQSSLERIKKDLAYLSGSLTSTTTDLDKTNVELERVRVDLTKAEEDLEKRREVLVYLFTVRNEQIRILYQFPERSILELFLSNSDLTGFSENLIYQSKVLGDSKELISLVNAEVEEMETARNDVQKAKDDLESLATSLNERLASLRKSQSSAAANQTYLSNRTGSLKSSLAGLTQKQNQLIAAKIGNSLATGALALADDANARVTFNPGFSPAFAGFSFGAYTHRNGMSQYGARARANAGQSAEQILGAYYPGSALNKNYPVAANITVNGTNEYGQSFSNEVWNFEEYVKHLYEVPSSWPMEVLKAQAVAARSYAVAYTNNGSKAICPSQSCQVVKKEINASSWQQAVEATRGWVLTGGSGFQYSSTSGGYLNTSGWDTTCGNISCWPAQAWESLAPSPWFYKGWYKTLGGATCGRSHPWLNETEFTDVLNSWVVYTKGNNSDKARVVTTDVACWGGSPYSISEMKSRAEALGGSYSKVYGVATTPHSGGYTSSISFVTDKGNLSIDGPTFKDIFNLRVPGHLVLKTPLYNIEKK